MNARKLNIVVKIGTLALSGADGAPDAALLDKITGELSALKKARHNVVLVTSGAVGTGRSLNRKYGPLRQCDPVTGNRIFAGMGQPQLMSLYHSLLDRHGIAAAQILLTKQDFRTRDHHKHIAELFAALRQQPHILPIVNENDGVTINELMFTDNDELAGLIAGMINADRLIILSHVAGVYDRPPGSPGARIIPLIDWQAKKGVPSEVKGKSGAGRGGMQSKLGVARKMATLGIRTQIAAAREENVISRLLANEELGTTIAPASVKRSAVKRWLASEVSAAPATVTANQCLAEIIRDHNQAISLLPVGLTAIKGEFDKGDLVQVVDESGKPLALGVARYSAVALRRALGKKQQPVFIHYDQLHRVDEA